MYALVLSRRRFLAQGRVRSDPPLADKSTTFASWSRSTSLHQTQFASMSSTDEKNDDKYQGETTTVTQGPNIYDPSQESIWTRLGLSLESYKRAPGTTACVPLLLKLRATSDLPTSGLVVHGSGGVVDPLVAEQNPMLQQQMVRLS